MHARALERHDNPRIRRDLLEIPPRTPRQLHAWVSRALGMDIPARPLCPGHDAPLAYLCHAFFEDGRRRDTPHALVWASRGSGKTHLAAIATLLDLIFKPGIRVCLLGGSFAQSAAMHEHLRRMLEDPALHHLVDGRITRELVRLRNGSQAIALGASATDIRGRRAHRLRCDEVELFDRDLWDAAQMITRSGRCGEVDVRAGVEALSTMHRPFGLMHALAQNAAQTGTRLFRWNVIDTLEHCDASGACATCRLFDDGCAGAAKRTEARGFVRIDDAISQRRAVSDSAWRCEMLCQRPDVTACVYPAFDEARHVTDLDPPADDSVEWLGGLDFGYRAPTALVLARLDGAGGLCVMDEIIERGCATPRMIELCRARLAALGIEPQRLRWIGADPAGLQRSDQTGLSTIALWRRAGFSMRTRAIGLEAGIEQVRARLDADIDDAIGTPALRVHRRCAGLRRALREYHYDPDDAESAIPVKDGPDHAADALRYLIINLDRPMQGVFRRDY